MINVADNLQPSASTSHVENFRYSKQTSKNGITELQTTYRKEHVLMFAHNPFKRLSNGL